MKPIHRLRLSIGAAVLCVLLGRVDTRLLGQTPSTTYADQEWANQNIDEAMNDLLPTEDRFGYAQFIAYRYEDWAAPWEREFSFCIMYGYNDPPLHHDCIGWRSSA